MAPTVGLRGVVALVALACAAAPSPERYRLSDSGTHWDVVGSDRVYEDLSPRYPEFFAVILDPSTTEVPDMRPIRDDLERTPVDRRNFDALNSLAVGYFETNYRAESSRGEGLSYLSLSQRSAKLLAVPWRAYGETDDPALRDAILDFFTDAARGEKLEAKATAPRLERIVSSLERKEDDPERLARMRKLAAEIRAQREAPPE